MGLWLKKEILSRLTSPAGSIFWYLVAAMGGIFLFYGVFFLFWAQIKGWFIHGS